MPPIPVEAQKALKAVMALGFSVKKAKPILNNLLKLYDYNWKYIEAENYKLLVEALLDSQDDEEVTKIKMNEEMMNEEPEHLSMLPPPGQNPTESDDDSNQTSQGRDPMYDRSIKKRKSYDIMPTLSTDRVKYENTIPDTETKSTLHVTDSMMECSKTIELASSASGEVKLAFICSSDINMPCLEDLVKMVDDEFMKSYRIIEPKISLVELMNKICHRALALGSKSIEQKGSLRSSSQTLVSVREHQDTRSRKRARHDYSDLSKGEEQNPISVFSSVGRNQLPGTFHYIPHNIVYQNGYVNFSLARIGDESCCSGCVGNCLKASIPCACARETGGLFAYTYDGLLKEDFLDDCISYLLDPHKHLIYCEDCPIERTKNEVKPEKCKGHLTRKFLKECWIKCGCSKQCGNRVVQRGITCNLQIFFTDEGKGWGVRTLDPIPRGAFVCEYIGEVLTNMELYERTITRTGDERHTYPVLLDADWGSEAILKDEEALCLDATFYGNIGRFINHRCGDANLIEIPVEIETPDHHYYHLAFFTTRRINAMEELTWDYGIDFDDHTHPIKAFECRCGSTYCRGNRKTRSRPST